MLCRVSDLERRVAAARDVLLTRQRDIYFDTEPELAAAIAALGMWREIGTPNDQLTRWLVTADTRSRLPVESARAEVIEYHGNIGIRVWYEGYARLASAKPHLQTLFHPNLSFNHDGTIREVVIFPLTVARIARLEDTRLVIVPSWTLDMPLSHRPQATPYYLDFATPEQWAKVPQQTRHYCQLAEHRTIPFLTTHDLADHLAGFRGSSWGLLVGTARKIRVCVDRLLAESPVPQVQTLILPFMAGYLLDILSQPVHGEDARISIVIDQVLETIDARAIAAQEPGVLRRFPQSYAKVIDSIYARSPPTLQLRDAARALLHALVTEIQQNLNVALPSGRASAI